MLKDIVNKFLANYHEQFSQAGYSVLDKNQNSSSILLRMISNDYILIFNFFNELPYRLVVDIKSNTSLAIQERNKNIILNKELIFFPFNRQKHEILDSIQKTICERFGIYEGTEAVNDVGQSSTDNLYNIRYPNQLFPVFSSMSKAICAHKINGIYKVFRFNVYVININKDGEIFYSTKIYYSFDNDFFIFNSNDNFYSYCGINYVESDLESLLFNIIVNNINSEIFESTQLSILNESEDFIKKAIDVYKMVKI